MAELNGNDSAETISGTARNDVVSAGGGDDTILASNGVDYIDGGTGSDRVDYSTYGGALSIVLKGSAETTVWGDGSPSDVLVNIENLIGGRRDDYFAGDDADNTFSGNGGNDYFVSSAGSDRYYGGSGYDTVDYSNTGTGIVISVRKDGICAVSAGGVVYDQLVSIENIIGTAFNDRIAGGKDDNEIQGGDGSDRLKGGAGGDVLVGQGGDDRLTGGKDADVFEFASGFGKDTITDFRASGVNHDVLDMRDVPTVLSFQSMLDSHRIWQDGDDVVIDVGRGDEVTLKNAHVDHLTAADFLF